MMRNRRRCRPEALGNRSMPPGGSCRLSGRRMGLLLLMALVSPGLGFSTRQRPHPRRGPWMVSERITDLDHEVDRRERRMDPLGPKDHVPLDRTRQRRAANSHGRGWMNQLYEHELLSKADEQRLGAAVQRARKLRESLDVLVLAKQQEQIQQLKLAELDRLDRFERWDEIDEFSDLEDSDDEDEELGNVSVYSSVNWNADELRPNNAFDLQRYGHLQFSEDLDLLDNDDIISQLGIQGGRQEMEKLLQEGDQARAQLLRCNFRLVVSIARRFANFKRWESSRAIRTVRPSIDEMIQEGILGLAKAVDRFQPEKNFRFGTYATFWITDSVRTCVFNHGAIIKLPPSYYNIMSKYLAAVKRYMGSEGEVPDLDRIGEEIGVTSDRLMKVIRMTQPLLSIDERRRSNKAGAAYYQDDSWDAIDDLFEGKMMKPDELIDVSFLRSGLEDAMASELAPIERDIIRLRLGLDDGTKRSARQVAQVFAPMLSLVDVQVAERNALKKLRSPHVLATYKLLSYLDLVGVDQSRVVLT